MPVPTVQAAARPADLQAAVVRADQGAKAARTVVMTARRVSADRFRLAKAARPGAMTVVMTVARRGVKMVRRVSGDRFRLAKAARPGAMTVVMTVARPGVRMARRVNGDRFRLAKSARLGAMIGAMTVARPGVKMARRVNGDRFRLAKVVGRPGVMVARPPRAAGHGWSRFKPRGRNDFRKFWPRRVWAREGLVSC